MCIAPPDGCDSRCHGDAASPGGLIDHVTIFVFVVQVFLHPESRLSNPPPHLIPPPPPRRLGSLSPPRLQEALRDFFLRDCVSVIAGIIWGWGAC